jgi:hypothetical protein
MAKITQVARYPNIAAEEDLDPSWETVIAKRQKPMFRMR